MFGASRSVQGGAHRDQILLVSVDCSETLMVCSSRRLHEATVICQKIIYNDDKLETFVIVSRNKRDYNDQYILKKSSKLANV
jgi:hypothetical protein